MVEVNEAEVRDMARQLVADVPPDQKSRRLLMR